MNEKAAKKLRRHIRNSPEAQDLPDVNYTREQKCVRKIPLDGLDKDGKVVYVTWPMFTISLGACKRAVYQRVKRALR